MNFSMQKVFKSSNQIINQDHTWKAHTFSIDNLDSNSFVICLVIVAPCGVSISTKILCYGNLHKKI
jgi:hypothetical protein